MHAKSLLVGCALLAGMVPSATSADGEDPQALRAFIDKAITAHGGAAKLARFKAARFDGKGKLYVNGTATKYTGQFAADLPDREWYSVQLEARGQEHHLVGAVSNRGQWETDNGKKSEPMSQAELAEERERMHSDWVASLRPLVNRSILLKPAGEAEVDGRKAVGVIVAMNGHRPVKLFFDREKALLLKSETQEKNFESGQESTRQELYSNYRMIEGLMIRTHTKTFKDGKLYSESESAHIKPLEKLDDRLFAAP
jgi:hypothetical protein